MSRNSNSLEARLAAYGSMSLAVAAVAMPGLANATTYNGGFTATASQPVYFDPATGFAGTSSSGSFDFELFAQSFGSGFFRDAILPSPNNGIPGNGNFLAVSASSLVAKLSPGASVGGGLTFGVFGTLAGNQSSDASAHWNALPAMGDLGLSQTQNCSAATCYAWANIVVNSDYSITLNAFGYDGSGAAIVAGSAPAAAPEPASILLLALGAAGIAAWRSKKAVAR